MYVSYPYTHASVFGVVFNTTRSNGDHASLGPPGVAPHWHFPIPPSLSIPALVTVTPRTDIWRMEPDPPLQMRRAGTTTHPPPSASKQRHRRHPRVPRLRVWRRRWERKLRAGAPDAAGWDLRAGELRLGSFGMGRASVCEVGGLCDAVAWSRHRCDGGRSLARACTYYSVRTLCSYSNDI